ncbi:hypothetical protein BURCENBC7_AP5122 [Burkholderia cenocepacia BC7]|nr:uncharacterized protein BCN122_II2472 [Burkholderia cenocepacia]EPZ89325.1 hypothetical protein BURCENK562V_C4227 [Burkholderia cenocepacia K56-2Valvano]ERI26362.1 hypothetical protein BURCENBC7_AP5122 [Burkholderia cenocepacia BC7]ESS39569.1 hypothetical protein P355_3634 [Burkholderia cenocepacia KC-01]
MQHRASVVQCSAMWIYWRGFSSGGPVRAGRRRGGEPSTKSEEKNE